MKKLLLALLLVTAPAAAQTPVAPQIHALSEKLLREINQGLECAATSMTQRQQIESLSAEVKRLKEKYETDKDAK